MIAHSRVSIKQALYHFTFETYNSSITRGDDGNNSH